MSPVALILNLLLGGLLIAALALGVRLDRRLRALRESQAGFIKAVAELDEAAGRAQAGMQQWRDATDEARELLHDRIEKAKAQTARLEKILADAAALPDPVAPPSAPATTRARGSSPPPAPDAGEVLDLARTAAMRPAARAPLPRPRPHSAVDDDLFEMLPVGAPRLQRDLAETLRRGH